MVVIHDAINGAIMFVVEDNCVVGVVVMDHCHFTVRVPP
jgi:hypothetical protein